jgi:hypothetical protein
LTVTPGDPSLPRARCLTKVFFLSDFVLPHRACLGGRRG